MISYISTRDESRQEHNFEDVLLQGMAPDGGLYVPTSLPQIDVQSLRGKSYIDMAEIIMFPFVEGVTDKSDFRKILEETYNEKIFRDKDVTPLHKLKDGLYVLELFHGPTIAFKDVALQFLGRVFEHILTRRQETVTIIGATSGDTGSAAIEGCRHSKHAQIFILHPYGRVSDVQRRQMTTVLADNVYNIAIKGNFDDCQNLVKAMFADQTMRTDLRLSAVNSINWARIMAQIVYYFAAAMEFDEPVNFVVPTGNFGNILAAYYARQMGLPIETLRLATNRNDILTRFFETGAMQTEAVEPTMSPSMDIQISSNFERFLFDLLDQNAAKLKTLMQQFKDEGRFELSADLLQKAKMNFQASRANEAETKATIQKIYSDTNYILDPHTAVGMKGALDLQGDTDGPVISLGCAHPAKFPDAVKDAIGIHPDLPEHLEGLLDRPEKYDTLPADLKTLQDYIKSHV